MLKIKDLSHAYDAEPVLKNIHLALAPGEILGLLGPAGCGKSTLLRLAAGLEPLQAGEVFLAGRMVADAMGGLPPERRNIGMVFQDFALFPHLTVGQNIAFGLVERSKADRRGRARLWAERIGMLDLIDAYPHMLSGGQQQRVALARALAPSPNLMLMDEPFSSLDSGLRDRLRDATLTLLKESGVATLLVTHDPDEAMRMADRILLMRGGEIEQCGRPLELYERPESAFVAAFLGATTQFEGQARDGKVQNDLGCFDAPILSGPVTLIVREEAFQRAKAGGVMALVTEARSLGREHLIGLRIGAIDLRARWTENRLPTLGERIPITLDPCRIHLFPKEV